MLLCAIIGTIDGAEWKRTSKEWKSALTQSEGRQQAEGNGTMELYQLQSFLTVVRTGSLSQAALARNISLPGISKHIKMLEDHFGQQLFHRTPKGMQLTQLGRQVLVFAERIDKELAGLQTLARHAPPLRLGFNLSPDFLELHQLKALLFEQTSHRDIVLTHHNSSPLLDMLARDELDMCLAFGTIPDRFATIRIDQVELPLMVWQRLPQALPDLSSLCWIVNSDDCPFARPTKDFWHTHGIRPESTILAQDLSRRELVAQELGIGFLEPQDGLALIRSGLGRNHDGHHIGVPLWVVFHDETLRPAAAALAESIRSRYAALPLPLFTGAGSETMEYPN